VVTFLRIVLIMVAGLGLALAAEPATVPPAAQPLTFPAGDVYNLRSLLDPVLDGLQPSPPIALTVSSEELIDNLDGVQRYHVLVDATASERRFADLTLTVRDGRLAAVGYTSSLTPERPGPRAVAAHHHVILSDVGGGQSFGGMLGIAASEDLGVSDSPFIDGALGIAGFRLGFGMAYYFNDDAPWFDCDLSKGSCKANAALGVRAVLVHRWFGSDAHRPEAIWGARTPLGNYLGIEGIVTIAGVSVMPGIYSATRDRDTLWAVAYGVGF
jgi:hypothetical protein